MGKNILLTIAYDGSNFHGWQRQTKARTVQGELEKALTRVLGREITVDGTSRTDAGVHAFGQKVSFKCDTAMPTSKFPMILNNTLSNGKIFNERIPGEISVIDAQEMPPDFHARFSAKGKKYVYKIRVSEKQDIFRRNYCYQLTQALDIKKMKTASEFIQGTHDFKSFEASGANKKESTVRTVYSLDIRKEDLDEIIIEVKGDGFLYNMVRIITGTLVEVGTGRRQPGDMNDIINSQNREKSGHTAPASGLYLVDVYYDEKTLYHE